MSFADLETCLERMKSANFSHKPHSMAWAPVFESQRAPIDISARGTCLFFQSQDLKSIKV